MDKKELLLHNAVQLFASRGYENVGVQELVESARVTKPTLYHYFGSKAGLLQALVQEYSKPFLEELSRVSYYQGDIVKSLQDMAMSFFRFAREQADFYKLIMISPWQARESEFSQVLMDYKKREMGYLVRMFQAAERDHGNMKGRSERYALSFYGTVNTYISYYFYDAQGLQLDEETSYVACHQFMHGIFS